MGNLAALWQTNIKRLLGYSAIAQAGYVLVGWLREAVRHLRRTLLPHRLCIDERGGICLDRPPGRK